MGGQFAQDDAPELDSGVLPAMIRGAAGRWCWFCCRGGSPVRAAYLNMPMKHGTMEQWSRMAGKIS